MKKAVFLFAVLTIWFSQNAFATPSTQIWIPSTDIQPFGVFHFGADTYNTVNKSVAEGGYNVINYGLTVGALPVDERFGLEVGIDYRDASGNSKKPWYYNAKFGVSEGAFGEISPAFAIGGYDFGGEKDVSNSNIVYGLAAKTLGNFGRVSVGYYSGNDKVLLDSSGKKDNTGILASWDRSFGEKFWGAVDYMGGKSAYGALSFGVSYAVSDGASFILGYDIYNNSDIKPTMTFQFDSNF